MEFFRTNINKAFRDNQELQKFVLPDVTTSGKSLGTGSFGTVEEVKYKCVSCAGKRFHEALIDVENEGANEMVDKYLHECQLMSSLRHPNITQFLGLCFLKETDLLPLLVMELLETNLDDLLESIPNLHLSFKRSVLEDVASGLLYLHERPASPVIHRDLTAKNVLLTSSLVAKITDMGNSRIIDMIPGQVARTLSKFPGTLVYMPPEALDDRSCYGPPLDIFSFGHLALFTLLQKFPCDLLQSTFPDPDNLGAVQGRTEVQRRQKYIDQLELGVLCSNHPSLIELVKQCLHNVPSERPTTFDLLASLQGMKVEVEGSGYDCSPIRLDMVRVRLVKEMKVKDRMIVDLTQQKERCEAQLEAMAMLESSGRPNQELLSEINRKEEEISAMQADAATKDELIASKERELVRKDEEIATRERDIARKDEQIASMERDIARKDEQIASMESDITRKDEQIATRERDIAGKDEQVAAMEGNIATKERDLVSKDEQMAAMLMELATTQRELSELLAEKDTLIQKLQLRESQWREELQERDAEIKRLREELKREQLPLQFPLQLRWRRGSYMPFGMVGYVQSVVVPRRAYFGGGHVENAGEDNYVIMEYDTSSGKWAKLPPYRACHFALTAINNQLVLVGGEQHGHSIKLLGVWNAESKEWTHPYPDMSMARSSCSAAVACDEWLTVAGGVEDGVVKLASVEVMNIVNKQWYIAPSTPTPWSNMKTAVVGDTCYFMGGYARKGPQDPTTEVYSVSLLDLIPRLRSPDSRERGKQHQIWKVIPGLVTTHSTPLSIGKHLLAVGGRNENYKAVAAIHLYHPDSGAWTKVGDVPTPRYSCACAMVRDGEILVTGGRKRSSWHNLKTVDIAVIMS